LPTFSLKIGQDKKRASKTEMNSSDRRKILEKSTCAALSKLSTFGADGSDINYSYINVISEVRSEFVDIGNSIFIAEKKDEKIFIIQAERRRWMR
jgi:hypothetical protein